jgi:hypothetical protein
MFEALCRITHSKSFTSRASSSSACATRKSAMQNFATKPHAPRRGTCLNIAEGAARVTRADKARAYAIARGEAAEVGAAIEIAVLVGAASAEDEARIVTLASRVVAMLTRLIR